MRKTEKLGARASSPALECEMQIAGCGLPKSALVCLLLAIALAAVPARAANPWESIANMLTERRTQSAATTATQLATPATPAVPMLERVHLREVPDESGTSTSSAVRALAAMGLTTATAIATAPVPGPAPMGKKAIDLGREVDESESLLATDLFKKTEIRRLLGDEPRFIYNPANRPDPMVVPWVRRAAIFKELSEMADAHTLKGEYDQAVAVYRKILELRDPRFTAIVQTKLAAIAQQQNVAAIELARVQPTEMPVELPAWINDNTTGVIISPGTEICLVGEYMLRPGDTVPNYPEVRIASIAPRKVTYQIRNKSFEVILNNN